MAHEMFESITKTLQNFRLDIWEYGGESSDIAANMAGKYLSLQVRTF